MHLMVTGVERIHLRVPFREHCRRWMEVDLDALSYVDVFRVTTTDSAIVGWGECPARYGTHLVSDEAVARVIGANPAEVAFDDSLGQGLQMAMLDALGQYLEVPLWRLLRPEKVRSECALSWWSGQLTPLEAYADEARMAESEGYLAHKIKVRPWSNIFAQMAAISEVTSPMFHIDLDWNGTLQSRGEAAAVLAALDAVDRVGIYESPVRMTDIDAMRALRRQVNRPLAEHYRAEHYRDLIQKGAVDGLVVSEGGVTAMLRDADIAHAFEKACWIQIIGAGLTTGLALHMAAVSPGARWPIVTVSNVYERDLLAEPLELTGGFASVPTAPGLGVSIDRDALETYRIERGHVHPTPRRMIVLSRGGGAGRVYPAARDAWLRDVRDIGWSFVRPGGVSLEIREDDGTAEFDRDYKAAQKDPRSSAGLTTRQSAPPREAR